MSQRGRRPLSPTQREQKKQKRLLNEQLARDVIDGYRLMKGWAPLYPAPSYQRYKSYHVMSAGTLGDGCRRVLAHHS